MTYSTERPEPESLRLAMEAAWRDHHHARDQTWKALQIEAVLGAGLITVDAQFGMPLATSAAGVLVILSTFFGILISLNHRKLERRKFIHITNCETLLGLHHDDIIPWDSRDGSLDSKHELIRDGAVSVPSKLTLRDIFNFKVNNTAVFILRMHFAIMLFAFLVVAARIIMGQAGSA